MLVIGKKFGTFVDRERGNVIEYGHLHVIDREDNVEGQTAEVVKLPAALQNEGRMLRVGSEIELVYDKKGRAQRIRVMKEPEGDGCAVFSPYSKRIVDAVAENEAKSKAGK